MLSTELIKQIRKIQFRARHLVTDSLAGGYVSAFRGQGMEFDEVREYTPGDDVRTIDWNVTARMNQPFVKVFREEREMTLMLMVDVSPSQAFGTGGHRKNTHSAEVAAVLAFLAIKTGDKVGLIVFSDHVEQYIPPKKGRSHVWHIIRSVLSHKREGRKTDISEALEFFNRVQKKKCMCFLISDFWAEGYEKPLTMASRYHDLTCVKVQDPREEEFTPCGMVSLVDAETGERVVVDTSSKSVRAEFERSVNEHVESYRSLLKRNRVDAIDVSTSDSVTGPLVAYFKQREKRKRR